MNFIFFFQSICINFKCYFWLSREVSLFFQSYSECLTSSDLKVYNSSIKVLPDFVILSSGKLYVKSNNLSHSIFKSSFFDKLDKANVLIKCALKGSLKHNADISKYLYDSVRLLQLEKYVY